MENKNKMANNKRRTIDCLNTLRKEGSEIIILSYAPKKKNAVRVVCKCSCGNKYETTVASALLSPACRQCQFKVMAGKVTKYNDQYLNSFIGMVFGKWTVVSIKVSAKVSTIFNTICSCGGKGSPRLQGLIKGTSKSCGCSLIERNAARKTHGQSGKNRTTEYVIWSDMIQRCTNSKNESYLGYGAKGVKVCDRWLSFENFYADMGKRPVNLTLDRYPDKNGNYEPGNCRWATNLQQGSNKNINRHLELYGEIKTIPEWSLVLGVSSKKLDGHLRRNTLPFGLKEFKTPDRIKYEQERASGRI